VSTPTHPGSGERADLKWLNALSTLLVRDQEKVATVWLDIESANYYHFIAIENPRYPRTKADPNRESREFEKPIIVDPPADDRIDVVNPLSSFVLQNW
jgi:hypothetical protein